MISERGVARNLHGFAADGSPWSAATFSAFQNVTSHFCIGFNYRDMELAFHWCALIGVVTPLDDGDLYAGRIHLRGMPQCIETVVVDFPEANATLLAATLSGLAQRFFPKLVLKCRHFRAVPMGTVVPQDYRCNVLRIQFAGAAFDRRAFRCVLDGIPVPRSRLELDLRCQDPVGACDAVLRFLETWAPRVLTTSSSDDGNFASIRILLRCRDVDWLTAMTETDFQARTARISMLRRSLEIRSPLAARHVIRIAVGFTEDTDSADLVDAYDCELCFSFCI